ncbi:MAG: ion transporter [Candidatus Promineifilaceae bacterium]
MERDLIFLTGDSEETMRRSTYLVFITAVATLSLIVAVAYYVARNPNVKQVLFILDAIYALIFLIDFLLRLILATDRRKYLFWWGCFDLVTSIPGFPFLRVLRSLRVIRSSRAIWSMAPRDLLDQARERFADSFLFLTVTIGLLVLSMGSILIVSVEAGAPGATINSGGDAMWWSLVTMSTVGYGDEVPVTPPGRIIGSFMIVIGVALFTSITSYLASNFAGRGSRKERRQQFELAKKNQEHLEELLQRVLALEEKIAEKLGVEEEEDG